jgi:hypothetical protein
LKICWLTSSGKPIINDLENHFTGAGKMVTKLNPFGVAVEAGPAFSAVEAFG